MKLIVGLGNVGEKYKNTRHNAGWMFLDVFGPSKFKGIKVQKLQSMMNSSGDKVLDLVKNYHIDSKNLFVAHDDLDLPLGEYKIQLGKGPKVHNGVNSVERALGTSEFWRVRIGIDNREPENRTPGDKYVLQDFSVEDRKILDEIIPKIASELKKIVNG